MTSSPDVDTPGAPPALAAPGVATVAPELAVPARASGVELIGELPGSGYRDPPALVRRSDGQTIQLTRLLYLVLEAVDGHRGHDEIAGVVSSTFGRAVTAADVHQLVDGKLRPLGVLKLADGSEPEVKKSNPLLGLRFRYVVSDPERTRRITRPFAALFQPLVVAALVAAFVVTCGWVLFEKGLASATHQAFDQPGLLLLVFVVTILSAGFHEFGHAAACRYGGATPGVMGAGVYLVWPAFYTEVSDSYRLGRGGRLRVDLGGLYFNAIVAVAMFGAWAVSQYDAILLVIATQVLQMVRQMAPFVRFDGYHILADLTGVPDLYSHIKPTLLSLLPWKRGGRESSALKPWARAVVASWVLIVVPLLLLMLALIVLTLPRVLGTAWVAVSKHWQLLTQHGGEGDLAAATVRLLSILAIALTMLGLLYLLARVMRQVTAATWRSTKDRPVRRALAGLVAAALLAGVAMAWWPDQQRYRPIQAYERGTLLDALPVASERPLLNEGQVSEADSVWASAEKLPTRDEPQLALVLIPRSGQGSPWVFPFNRPDAPGRGGSQALAVNTANGSIVYDVAFALVWADDGSVLNRNEAYAFASCQKCRTVAVGFQVVLVVGQADLVVPQNISGAVNYNCLQCVTFALAKQLVITLPKGLSPAARAKLTKLWKEIQKFGGSISKRKLSPREIQTRLKKYEAALRTIVAAEAAAATSSTDIQQGTASPSAPASPSASEQATESASPQPEAEPTGEETPSTEASPAQSPSPSPTASESVATP